MSINVVNSFKLSPPAFLPSNIAGLKLWLDAGVGITEASNFVSAWADQSGTGNDMTQGTGGNQPLIISSVAAFNGFPVVRFDGNNDFMNRSTYVGSPITTGFSVYMVASDPTGSDNFWYDGVTDRAAFFHGGAATVYALFSTLTVTSVVTPSGDPAVIFRMRYDGSSSSIFKDRGLIVNGDDGGGAMDGISLASNESGGANLNLDIAEMTIYDSILSTQDDDDLMTFFENKYAL